MAKIVEKQNKKRRKTLLWVGLGILAAGLLAFGGAFLFGMLTLARDLLFTAVGIDALLVGGTLAAKAVNGIANAVSKKNKDKNLQRTQERNREKEQTQEETLGEIPVVSNTRSNSQTNVVSAKTKNSNTKRR